MSITTDNIILQCKMQSYNRKKSEINEKNNSKRLYIIISANEIEFYF